MKFTATLVLLATLASSNFGFAQELSGKYSGTYTSIRGYPSGLSVEISNIEGGKVTGKVTRNPPAGTQGGAYCAGTFNVIGTFKQDTLRLRTTEKGGAAGDCTVALEMKLAGNKLAGRFNGMDAEVTK